MLEQEQEEEQEQEQEQEQEARSKARIKTRSRNWALVVGMLEHEQEDRSNARPGAGPVTGWGSCCKKIRRNRSRRPGAGGWPGCVGLK